MGLEPGRQGRSDFQRRSQHRLPHYTAPFRDLATLPATGAVRCTTIFNLASPKTALANRTQGWNVRPIAETEGVLGYFQEWPNYPSSFRLLRLSGPPPCRKCVFPDPPVR